MIRAVVFDAVGTLLTPDPAAGVAYHLAGMRHGSKLTEADVVRRFGTAFRETLRRPARDVDPHRTDEATERLFWRSVVTAVFDDLSSSTADACFEDLFNHFAQPASWRVYHDVEPALQQLRSRYRTLAVASNFDRRLHAVFAGQRELDVIDRRFVSSEIGWRKPDPRFFATVSAGLGCRCHEVLYVGDDPDSDVDAAAAAGMKSMLLARGAPAGVDILTDLRQLSNRLGPTQDAGLP